MSDRAVHFVANVNFPWFQSKTACGRATGGLWTNVQSSKKVTCDQCKRTKLYRSLAATCPLCETELCAPHYRTFGGMRLFREVDGRKIYDVRCDRCCCTFEVDAGRLSRHE